MSIHTYLQSASTVQEILNLQELKITQTVNAHATLLLTAKLTEEAEINHIRNVKALDIIEVAVEGIKPTYDTIFKGIVKSLQVQRMDKYHLLTVEALSGSYLADIEIRSRSFQNENETYESIVKKVITAPFSKNEPAYKFLAEKKADGEVADNATKGAVTGGFVMQYKETDWEFIKRMASRFYAGLVPSLLWDEPKVVMGIPNGSERGTIEKYNFISKKDLQRFLNMSRNTEFEEESGKGKFSELDAVTFYIETSEDFDIGDTLTYQYHEENTRVSALYVKSKEIKWD